MLLKMYKFDMKNVSLPLIVVHAVLLVLTLAEVIMLQIVKGNNSGIFEIPVALVAVLLVLTAIVAFVMTNLTLILRFYKRMFTNEGYLTNALPMTADQKILSHSLCYLTWYVIDVILIGLCFMMSVGFFSGNTVWNNSFATVLGLGIVTIMLIIIASGSLLSEIAHLASSIGHLFPANKGLMTFIFYLLLGLVLQIVGVVFVFCTAPVYADLYHNIDETTKAKMGVFSTFGPYFILIFVFVMALAAAMYFISRWIIKKYLNLAG